MAQILFTPSGGAAPASVWSCDVEPTADPSYVPVASYQRGGADPFVQWNPSASGAISYATVPYGLQITAGASSAVVAGLLESVPAAVGTEFSITAKLPAENTPVSGSGTVFCLLLGGDLIANPTTAPFVAVGANYSTQPASTGNAILIYSFTNHTTLAGIPKLYVFSAYAGLPPNGEYAQAAPGSLLRLSVDAAHANYCFAVSTDGEVWFEIQGPRPIADLPGGGPIRTMGLLTYNGSTLARRLWVPWFRYRQGAGTYRNYSPEGGLT